MLDMICLTGEAGWARLSPAQPGPEPTLASATPIALFLLDHAGAWRSLRTIGGDPPLCDEAQRVIAVLRSRGASFLRELAPACGLDSDQVLPAIGALAACGLATSDGFSGLRALVRAAQSGPARHDQRGMFAGRWTAIATGSEGTSREEAIEQQAWTLLRRYGVVFRRLLTREANAAPWRELARVYRRLEARGEIRCGRFVSGMSGEQFALPQGVERLREVRRSRDEGRLIPISAADPLNLAGIVTSGERIRAASRSRIVYRDGVPIALMEAGVVRALTALESHVAADVSRALGGASGRALADTAPLDDPIPAPAPV
jgi:ATP-dependent Lhr-like helicase